MSSPSITSATAAPTPSITDPPSPALPNPQSLFSLRTEIIAHLTQAIASASERISRAAAGDSVFTTDAEARNTLALLRHLPALLPHLPNKPPPPPPHPDAHRYPRHGIPLIPICPLCLTGPGGHWVEYCPDFHTIRDNAERVTHLKSLQGQGRVK